MSETLPVLVYFDFICPWSYIGKNIFDGARNKLPRPIEQHTGLTPKNSLFQAFPLIAQAAFAKNQSELKYHDEVLIQSRKIAKKIGLNLNFSAIRKISNPMPAFCLVTYLQRENVMEFDKISKFINIIFSAYFVDGHDIEDIDLLLHLGKFPRFHHESLRNIMQSSLYKNAIETSQLAAKRKGILTTPSFVFDNRFQISSVMDKECFNVIGDIIRQEQQDLAKSRAHL